MELKFHHRTLELKSPFRLSRSVTTQRRTLIVELTDGVISGFGEVSDNGYYPGAEPRLIEHQLLELNEQLHSASPDAPFALHAQLSLKLTNPFALAALDMAAHDLAARRKGLPLYRYWGLEWQAEQIPVSNYTLSVGDPEQVLAQARANPWPSYKVKLGGGHDFAAIARLRAELPEVQLSCDANAGWSAEEALRTISDLRGFELKFVEQPLKEGEYRAVDSLRQNLRDRNIYTLLVADEDCQTEADIDRCAGCYDVVNIKLVKSGGPSVALRMAARARVLGLGVMFGCMVESSFGIGLLRHLAPLADFLDLDGHLLIANDPGTGVGFEVSGKPSCPQATGSGIDF